MSNQWGTVTFEIPDFLEDTRTAINTVAEFLVTVLDIALTALQFAKAFLVGFLDPIAALVKLIKDEIKALLRDMGQLGLYMTGDWTFRYPYDELLGGFSEYERRMIARLTDRTDVTRPDVSAKTKVLSMFFYLSVDLSEVQRLRSFIKMMMNLFRQSYNTPGSYPVPVITDVLYGNSGASFLRPQDLPSFFTTESSPPDVAVIKWKVTSPQKNPLIPIPAIPPGGFMVTVSTLKDGLPIYYNRAQGDSTEEKTLSGVTEQPQESGVVRTGDGKPLVIHGGSRMIVNHTSVGYNQSTNTDKTVKPVRGRIYGAVRPTDNTVIPLDQLTGSGGKYFFQDTFYVSLATIGSQWAMGEYSLTLKLADLPRDARIVQANGQMTAEDAGIPGTYYVRVASCTKELGSGKKQYRWDLAPLEKTILSGGPVQVALGEDVPEDSISEFSEPKMVSFPGANTQKYLQALESALVVLVLCRPDLLPLDQLRGVVTEDVYSMAQSSMIILDGIAGQRCGLEPMAHLTGLIYDDYRAEMAKKGESVIDFRQYLRDKVKVVARDIFNATGSNPAVEALVVQQSKTLREGTWGDIFTAVHSGVAGAIDKDLAKSTILDSVDPSKAGGGILDAGLALSPYSMSLTEGVVKDLFKLSGVIQDRKPQFLEAPSAPDKGFDAKLTATKTEMITLVMGNPGLLMTYEKFRKSDGSMVIPAEFQPYFQAIRSDQNQLVGSADGSPVFYMGLMDLVSVNPGTKGAALDDLLKKAGVFYCRGLLALYQSGKIITEAALALSLAASAIRRTPEDGEWLNLRLFDAMPAMEDFLAMILNWVEAISKSFESIVDTIKKYIEFIEGRLVELQQFIQRINQLIQTLLGFAFQIPKCSFLLTVSNGTGGVLTDLVAADNKPNDSPLAYGGGIAVVIPFGPAHAMDIIKAIIVANAEDPPPVTQGITSALSGPPIPLPVVPEDLPPVPPLPPEPDVL